MARQKCTQYPSWFGLWGPLQSDYPGHLDIDWRTWAEGLHERFTGLDLDRPIGWHVSEEELPPPSLESKAYDTLASRGKVTRTQNRFSRGLWGALQCSEPGYLDHGWYLWVATLGLEHADQRRALEWIAPEEKLGMEHADQRLDLKWIAPEEKPDATTSYPEGCITGFRGLG